MNPREAGFLLLTSHLGDPHRHPLTPAQMRTLANRVAAMEKPETDRELETADLIQLGYGREMAARIVALLSQEDVLTNYLQLGRRSGCVPVSLAGELYPSRIRKVLGFEAPGCLWAKGDLSILDTPMIAVVGSRDLEPLNGRFAAAVGAEAARQGYTLVSGNARGADRIAQNACLNDGGRVISIVADELEKQPDHPRILWLSEDGYGEEFSAQRALSRNRSIHALAEKTFVAQCTEGKGGTWDGTVKNLRFGWSPVFAFDDGSHAMALLRNMGAELIGMEELGDLSSLQGYDRSFLEE